MNPQVMLVGNGRSLLGSGLGKTIDSFPAVMRLNNYCVYGFESDVGTKRTYQCRTYNIRPTSCKLPHVIPPEDNKGISGLQDNRLEDFEECVFSPQFKSQHLCKCPEYSRYRRCVDVSAEQMAECRNACRYEKGWVSTGALAIWYAVKRWGQIGVCGFDCLQGDVPTEFYGYYYMDEVFPNISGTNHFLELETAMVARLAEEGKVTVWR
jgi:hypothetical protein